MAGTKTNEFPNDFSSMYRMHKNDKIQSTDNEKPDNVPTSAGETGNEKKYLTFDNQGYVKEKPIDIVRVDHLEQSRL